MYRDHRDRALWNTLIIEHAQCCLSLCVSRSQTALVCVFWKDKNFHLMTIQHGGNTQSFLLWIVQTQHTHLQRATYCYHNAVCSIATSAINWTQRSNLRFGLRLSLASCEIDQIQLADVNVVFAVSTELQEQSNNEAWHRYHDYFKKPFVSFVRPSNAFDKSRAYIYPHKDLLWEWEVLINTDIDTQLPIQLKWPILSPYNSRPTGQEMRRSSGLMSFHLGIIA